MLTIVNSHLIISKCKFKTCPNWTKIGPTWTYFGSICPKNGVGWATILHQKFNFSKILISSKFKLNPPSLEVKKKIHSCIFKCVFLKIITLACTKTWAGCLKKGVGLLQLCTKTWAECTCFGAVCPSFGIG